MRLSLRLVALLLLGALLPLYNYATAAPPEQTIDAVPADFTDTVVASVASPTALAFTPDGRMLITTQPGRLRVYQNGSLLATPALDLNSRLCTNSERGMLGVAVDPAFTSNRFIYLYYTFNKNNTCANNTANSPVNRVSRFVLPDNNVISTSTEVVLVDNMPSPNGNHNAGDLKFGKDGYLYISIGDGGCDYAGNSGCAGANDAARDQHVLTGKILRVTRDGGIPPDNPFQGANTARCNTTGRTNAGWRCQETFAWGLRNPFRFGFDPNASGTRFFINDVGQGAWEEIDQAQAGADYGWHCREGAHTNSTSGACNPTPPNMVDPIYEYGRTTGCASITGGAFVPNGVWPADYDGDYLFADYVCGRIFRLQPNGSGGYSATDFATGLGGSSAVHLTFGPYNSTQALYYTTYANSGQVRRIAYTPANAAPTADITASPTSGSAPLAVNFNGSGSSDPNGDTLTYIWNFGDGSATRETSTPTTSYTYNTTGSYTASLTVRDSRGAVSTPDTIRIDVGNTPPTPTITAPTPSKLFFVGETITLSGSATDPQDGTLPASALSWRVILHHDTHTHPFFGPTSGNNLTFTAPAPEDLAGAQTSYLEIQLTATDSQGLSTTITQNLQPRKVNVTFNTAPAGLRVDVNGTSFTGPSTVVSWDRYVLNVSAPNQTDSTGRSWEFQSWSDGGAQAHAITTPGTATTYTATFREVTGGGTGTGLTGVYYDNMNFTGTRVQRVDPTVNFDWGTGVPAPGIGADTFSVRWVGQVQPRYSQTYTFYTLSDNGVRLWVNGQQIINNWTEHALTENSGTIALTAGQKYMIVMEFYDNTGGAVAKLSWSSASQAKEIIPQSQLYPQFSGRINFQPAASTVPAGYLPDGGVAFGARGNGYNYGWNGNNSGQARDRNASNSPDQRYDTLNHMQKAEFPNAIWEIEVPNGTYSVRIVSGDPSHFDSVYRLNAEGTLAVNGTPTTATRWIEGTVSVAVSDGRLTIGNASGASNNKICFIEITGQ